MPTQLSYDEAVEAVYREDLDWIEEKLRARLSVLIECDKQLSNYIYKALRKRFRATGGPSLRLLSGHPRAPDPDDPNPMQANATLTQRLLDELREAIYGARADGVFAITHLDILTTTTRSSLGVEAREAAAIMYENPDLVFLGFTDPNFEIPEVIEKVFTVKYSIVGIGRDKLPHIILQREARKFGVTHFNPYNLYKYLSGLNAVRARQVLNQLESRIDFDPNHPKSVELIYQDIRKLTLVGDLEVPRVSLDDDIGGYKKVKSKIRKEILDLLLAKESLSSAEDIRAIEEIVPKGMIFHGPPGTGKTFFAKAIATALNATVSIVSGPELKSKWVGESLPWEEEILVTVNGKFRAMPIGKLVEEHADDEVMAWTFDDQGQGQFLPVTGFLTHEGPDYIDVLTTEMGREVRVTGGHSLFVNQKGRISEVFAEDVVEGQTRIAVPLHFAAPETTTSVNLLHGLRHVERVHVLDYEPEVRQAIEVLGKQEVEARIGKTVGYKRQARVELAAFMDLMDLADVTPDPARIKLYCHHRQKHVSAHLEIDESFSEFLGFWVADGSFGSTRSSVRLATNVDEVDHLMSLCESLFGHVTRYDKKGKGIGLTISSKILFLIMTQALDLTHGSHLKRAPGVIFTAPKACIAAFLRGYFSGDGTFSGKYIEATTTSRGLASDVATLLQFFGIAARLRHKSERNGRDATRVRFLWSAFLRTFADEIGFTQEARNQKLNAYLDGMTFKRDKQTPTRYITRGLIWDKVVSVRREPYARPHVYDISVPGTERFVAGFGNVLVHNSEENLRKVFAQARKSAPAIIIFDELDSFASARGTYTGSGVEHSMVNQLLTEMDGFRKEELVFVVGTTNFVESLDQALMRPGRFELAIEIPYPNKRDRKTIFEIYARKFGLTFEEGVLDHMVKRTQGFVDAAKGVRHSGDHLYAIMRGLKREQMRRGAKSMLVTQEDADKVLGKRNKQRVFLEESERRTVAVHEAGHAILAYCLPHCPTVERITIASEEEAYLGYVMHATARNQHIRTRSELLDSICVALGGREAEQLILGDVSSGCWNDLQQATSVATMMVEQFGMSQEMGLRAYRVDQGNHAPPARDIADITASRVDEVINDIIMNEQKRCIDTLTTYRKEFDELVELLIEKKTIGLDEMKEIFDGRSFKVHPEGNTLKPRDSDDDEDDDDDDN